MKLPKLHLRDLFWLTLACALGLGWWVQTKALREAQSQWETWEWRAVTMVKVIETREPIRVTFDDQGIMLVSIRSTNGWQRWGRDGTHYP